MAKKTHAERRAAGKDALSIFRGAGTDPDQAAAETEARLGPLGSFVVDFAFGDVWSRPGLSRRDRSLVVVSILSTLNQLNQLSGHVKGAINHGLTRTEVEEIMVQLGGYAGFPRAIDAMTTARAAMAELEGVEVLAPSPPATPKDDEQRSADAREVMGRLSVGQPPGGAGVDMGSFTGTAGRFAVREHQAAGVQFIVDVRGRDRCPAPDDQFAQRRSDVARRGPGPEHGHRRRRQAGASPHCTSRLQESSGTRCVSGVGTCRRGKSEEKRIGTG